MNHSYALITGGSQGLGFEIARLLAQKGYSLILASRSKAKLEKAKNIIEAETKAAVKILPVDLSDPEAVGQLTESTAALNVEILVNNAGIGMASPLLKYEASEALSLINLNISALTQLCIHFSAYFSRKKSGYILNIGSVAGLNSIPFFSVYAASKSYVANFTLSLRRELLPFGVGVTLFEPGFMKTGFDQNAGIKDPGYLKMSEAGGMEPERAARIAVKAMLKKKPRSVPGVFNKLTAVFSKLLPSRLTTNSMYHVLQKSFRDS